MLSLLVLSLDGGGGGGVSSTWKESEISDILFSVIYNSFEKL